MNVVYCFTNNGEKMCLNDATIGLKGGMTVSLLPTLKCSLQLEGFFYLNFAIWIGEFERRNLNY
jgi:DNA modification methylase